MRHGKGKCAYKNGSFYEGMWKNDLPHGNGRFITPDGNQYVGFVFKG